jgi:Tfp pilus assembly protein PilZ
VHSPIPFRIDARVRLTFCTLRNREPLELKGRIAWNNPGGGRKQTFPAYAGIQFTECNDRSQSQLQDYVYELVEETLSRANLI